MSIEASDDFEGPALDWLFQEVQRLVESLREAGVTDLAVQRSVCESFFFGLTVLLDGADTGSSVRPVLAMQTDRALLGASDSFEFHDYVFGVVGQSFGEE